MGSTSIVVDRILNENLTMDEILAEDYGEHIDSIGKDIVRNRTRHATLGLSTIKAAVRAYKKNFAHR
jgi:nitrogen fixation NifU-like protein